MMDTFNKSFECIYWHSIVFKHLCINSDYIKCFLNIAHLFYGFHGNSSSPDILLNISNSTVF